MESTSRSNFRIPIIASVPSLNLHDSSEFPRHVIILRRQLGQASKSKSFRLRPMDGVWRPRRSSITSELLSPTIGASRPGTASSGGNGSSSNLALADSGSAVFKSTEGGSKLYTQSRRSSLSSAATGLIGAPAPHIAATAGVVSSALGPSSHPSISRAVHDVIISQTKHDKTAANPALASVTAELMSPDGVARRTVLGSSAGVPATAFIAGSASVPKFAEGGVNSSAAPSRPTRDKGASGWGATLAGFGSNLPPAPAAPVVVQRRASASGMPSRNPSAVAAEKPRRDSVGGLSVTPSASDISVGSTPKVAALQASKEPAPTETRPIWSPQNSSLDEMAVVAPSLALLHNSAVAQSSALAPVQSSLQSEVALTETAAELFPLPTSSAPLGDAACALLASSEALPQSDLRDIGASKGVGRGPAVEAPPVSSPAREVNSSAVNSSAGASVQPLLTPLVVESSVSTANAAISHQSSQSVVPAVSPVATAAVESESSPESLTVMMKVGASDDAVLARVGALPILAVVRASSPALESTEVAETASAPAGPTIAILHGNAPAAVASGLQATPSHRSRDGLPAEVMAGNTEAQGRAASSPAPFLSSAVQLGSTVALAGSVAVETASAPDEVNSSAAPAGPASISSQQLRVAPQAVGIVGSAEAQEVAAASASPAPLLSSAAKLVSPAAQAATAAPVEPTTTAITDAEILPQRPPPCLQSVLKQPEQQPPVLKQPEQPQTHQRRVSLPGQVVGSMAAPLPAGVGLCTSSPGRARLRSTARVSVSGTVATTAGPPPSRCLCGRRTAAGRAYVLDADVGWDPDAILALCTLTRATRTAGVALAVVSSADAPSAPRAAAARWVLRRLGVSDSDILVASGARRTESEPFSASLLRKLSKAAEPPAVVGTLADISKFVAAQQAAGRAVTWIGTSAMTNLAALLSTHEAEPGSAPRPDRVIQHGACLVGVATNMRLDPGSARAALCALERLSVPLTLVTSDTTRWGLCWQEDGPEYESSSLAAILHAAWRSDAAVADVICAVTGRDAFHFASSLHAPLAVLVALDSCCEGAPPYVPAAPARVELDAGGHAAVRVASDAVARRAAAAAAGDGGGLSAAQAFWEGREPAPSLTLFKPLRSSSGAPANCVLSLGPLLPSEIDTFAARLLGTLLPAFAAAARAATGVAGEKPPSA